MRVAGGSKVLACEEHPYPVLIIFYDCVMPYSAPMKINILCSIADLVSFSHVEFLSKENETY